MFDVNVDALFRWHGETEFRGRQVFMRTLSAKDDSARASAALSAARKMRARLLSDSGERQEMMSHLESLDRKDLEALIRAIQVETARGLSVREVQPIKDPPEPTEPSLEAMMDAADKYDEEMADLAQRRAEWIEEHVDVYMERISKMEMPELLNLAADLEISSLCTRAYMDEIDAQTLFRSCYLDSKFAKSLFSSAGEAASVDVKAFRFLLGEYNELDRFTAEPEELKN